MTRIERSNHGRLHRGIVPRQDNSLPGGRPKDPLHNKHRIHPRRGHNNPPRDRGRHRPRREDNNQDNDISHRRPRHQVIKPRNRRRWPQHSHRRQHLSKVDNSDKESRLGNKATHRYELRRQSHPGCGRSGSKR